MTAAPRTAGDPTYALLQRMLDLGCHLLPLRPGEKKSAIGGWPNAEALGIEGARAHLDAGRNLGVNLGRSGMLCIDAENKAATDALIEAGFVPTVIPAKAQLVEGDEGFAEWGHKSGGAHFWLRVPPGYDPLALTKTLVISLPDGGTVDALAGKGAYAVAPPSRIVESPYPYAPAVDGPLHLAGDHPVAPLWLLDAGAPGCPAALAPLRGIFAPKLHVERVWDSAEQRAQSQSLSDEIDSISWEAWGVTGDKRLTEDGVDGCGCVTMRWRGSDNAKSVTLHNVCEMGNGAHVWSGTMRDDLGLAGEHVSRLDLSAAMRGVTRAEAARAVGLPLGQRGHRAITADSLREAAEAAAERADDPERCMTREVPGPGGVTVSEPVEAGYWDEEVEKLITAAEVFTRREAERRERMLASGRFVEVPVPPEYRVDGQVTGIFTGAVGASLPVVDAETVEVAPTPTTATPAVDDAIEAELVDDVWEDGDQAMWARNREIEAQLRGARGPDGLWIGMTPALGRMANIAESRGIYFLGFIEACLVRVSARVPANVLLTPRAEGIRDKAEGVSLSYNAILLGPPATGKTTTQTAAASAVPLPDGIAQCPTGTAEGIVKKARTVAKGGTEPVIHASSVYVETDEITSVRKELKRDSSMYTGFVNSTFFGNTLVGMTTSEGARNATIPAHSTRFAQQVGAQPQLCGPLFDDAGSGITSRFGWAFTGSLAEDELGPLYGKPVPALLPPRMPWDPPPGVPFGFVRAPEDPAAEDGSLPVFEPMQMEGLEAEWVPVPRDPEEVRAARAEAARRSRHTRAALTEDRESGRTSGHDFIRVSKAAVLLWVMDAGRGVELGVEHITAAKLLAEATALAAAEAKIQSDSEEEAEAKRAGRKRGVELTTARATAEDTAEAAIEAAADALYAKLARPVEGVLVKGKRAKGFGGHASVAALTAASAVRPEHRPHRKAGLQLLIHRGRVTVAADGTVSAVVALAA